MNQEEIERTEVTVWDRIGIGAVALLVAAFLIGSLAPLLNSAGADVTGKRDDDTREVEVVSDDEDDLDKSGSRGGSGGGNSNGNSNNNSNSRSHSANTKTGTTKGTGDSKSATNSSDRSANTKTGTTNTGASNGTRSNSS